MSTIAIVAALEREIAPLVRNWESSVFDHEGRRFRVFQRENLVALAGGIGSAAASRAAKAVIAQFKLDALISTGLAGALTDELKVGSMFAPNVIIDASSGTEYRFNSGEGILVTASEIAETTSKHALAARYHAAAVDMEAAAVAEVARQQGIAFSCVKAISDEADFVMPPLTRFVSPDGEFQTARFVSWLAVHPKCWRQTMTLSHNSKRAAQVLCDYLVKSGAEGLKSGRLVKIETAELSQIKH
jgi:nucleoside phosphorylase